MDELLARDIEEVFEPEGFVNPGEGFISVDVLLDSPGIVTVAELRYANGVLYEITFTDSAEPEDWEMTAEYVPDMATRLGSHRSITHGNNSGWELTHSVWICEPPTE